MVPALSAAMTMPSLILTETMIVTAGLLFPVFGGQAPPPGGPSWSLSSARPSAGRLQEARHPTGCAQCLPRHSRGNREHNEGRCQRGTEQDAVLLQVGEGDQRNGQSRRDIAQ